MGILVQSIVTRMGDIDFSEQSTVLFCSPIERNLVNAVFTMSLTTAMLLDSPNDCERSRKEIFCGLQNLRFPTDSSERG